MHIGGACSMAGAGVLILLLVAAGATGVPASGDIETFTEPFWPLANMVLGKMPLRTSGASYHSDRAAYFVAMRPELDEFVSKAMLTEPSGWEGHLTGLFDFLEAAAPEPSRGDAVLDIGANFGAFSLHVAGKGRLVHAWEMQPTVYTCLELSRRINDYSHMRLHHAALWSVPDVEVNFTPVAGNLGGTGIVGSAAEQTGSGSVTMRTRTVSQYFAHRRVFFLKLDVEGAEDHVVSGMQSLFTGHAIDHFVWEHRPSQVPLLNWFYDVGYACGLYYSGRPDPLMDRVAAAARVVEIGLGDLYCTLSSTHAASNSSTAALAPRVPLRRLQGVFQEGRWR